MSKLRPLPHETKPSPLPGRFAVAVAILIAALYLAGHYTARAASSELTEEWVHLYNGPGPGSYEDQANDMVFHGDSVYWTGWTEVNYWPAYVTARLDSAGNLLWSQLYEGFVGPLQPDVSSALAVDNEGNVYVTGYSVEHTGSQSYYDCLTLKYDPAGMLLWEHRYRTTGNNCQPLDLVLDNAGYLYVVGATYYSSGFDTLVLKYTTDGSLVWERIHGQPGSHWEALYVAQLSPDGGLAAGGYADVVVPTLQATYTLKYSPAGDLLWEQHQDSSYNSDQTIDLAVDPAGNVYALAYYSGEIHTYKYSPAGALLWEAVYSGTSDNSDYPSAIALAPDGNVVIVGTSWDLPNTISMLTVKYEPENGAELWRHLHRAGYAQASGKALAIDLSGNIYVTGFAYNVNGQEDAVTLKYSPAGALLSEAVFNGSDAFDYGYFIAVDSEMNVYVTGESAIPNNYVDILTIKYGQPPALLVDAGADQEGDEGQPLSFQGTYTATNLLDNATTILWDFGDGYTATNTLTPTHTYADNGLYTVTLTVTDDQGNSASDSLEVTTNNVAPLLAPLPGRTIQTGAVLTVTGTYTDPGLLDSHNLTIIWADGAEETLDLGQGQTGFTVTHIYGAPGTYDVTVTLVDDDGGQAQGSFVVTVLDNYQFYLPAVLKP